jgi:hypothetical protein
MEDDTRKNVIGIAISLGLWALACFLLFQPVLANVMPLLASGHDDIALAEVLGRSLSQNQDEREMVWTCDDGILAEYEKMVAIPAHPQGRWIARGDKILFANQADLAAYQDDINAARDHRNQELAAVADLQMRTRQLSPETQAQ